MVYNLTAGGLSDSKSNPESKGITDEVFNEERYPGIWNWYHALEAYLESLPNLESEIEGDGKGWKETLNSSSLLNDEECLVPTPAAENAVVDVQRGLVQGAMVSIAPDDTGKDDPTIGTLVRIGVEEVIIRPSEPGEVDVRIHFPRLGFRVRVVEGARL